MSPGPTPHCGQLRLHQQWVPTHESLGPTKTRIADNHGGTHHWPTHTNA